MSALAPTINTIGPHSDMVRTLRLIQRRGYTSAIIAGGAIRDMYFNTPVKDIDIFLWDHNTKACPEKTTATVCLYDEKFISRLLNLDETKTWYRRDFVMRSGMGEDEDYPVTQYVTQVWSVVKNDLPYQLIFLNKDPLEYVDRHFDLALSKAYCDGYKIRYTKDFSLDAQRRTLTICSHGLTQAHFDYICEEYVPRIKEKYPNFVTKVAPHNAHLVDDKNIHLI